jgi:Tfp pilus assembly protein FimV
MDEDRDEGLETMTAPESEAAVRVPERDRVAELEAKVAELEAQKPVAAPDERAAKRAAQAKADSETLASPLPDTTALQNLDIGDKVQALQMAGLNLLNTGERGLSMARGDLAKFMRHFDKATLQDIADKVAGLKEDLDGILEDIKEVARILDVCNKTPKAP